MTAVSWLKFAATPCFAIMALWTGLWGGQADILCMGAHGAASLSGMVPMYTLMSAFHAAPWLKLILRQRSRSNGPRAGSATAISNSIRAENRW